MLLNLREYHRPGESASPVRQREHLDAALALLARSQVRTRPLAGGDTLVGSADPSVEAVVDLAGLGLSGMTLDGDRLSIGAMTTRSTIAASAGTYGHLGALLAEAAARWGGSVQRNRATVGGAIAVAAANDPLVVALLACDATAVLYATGESRELPLVAFLQQRAGLLAAPALITDVVMPGASAGSQWVAGQAAVARTPSDAPIVVAVAVLSLDQGRCLAARLAVGGVAPTPVRLETAEARLSGQVLSDADLANAAREAMASVRPSGDYRGSAEYRQAMVEVLSERALWTAWAQAR